MGLLMHEAGGMLGVTLTLETCGVNGAGKQGRPAAHVQDFALSRICKRVLAVSNARYLLPGIICFLRGYNGNEYGGEGHVQMCAQCTTC